MSNIWKLFGSEKTDGQIAWRNDASGMTRHAKLVGTWNWSMVPKPKGEAPSQEPKHKAEELLTESRTACTNGAITIYRTEIDTYRVWKEAAYVINCNFIGVAVHLDELKEIADRENFNLFAEVWTRRAYDI